MRAPERGDPISWWLTYYLVVTPYVYLIYLPMLWYDNVSERYIKAPFRRYKAKRRLKKDGIDHIVNL